MLEELNSYITGNYSAYASGGPAGAKLLKSLINRS